MIDRKVETYRTWPVRNQVLECLNNQPEDGWVIIGGTRMLAPQEDTLTLWVAPKITTIRHKELNELLRNHLISKINPIKANMFSYIRQDGEGYLILANLVYDERLNQSPSEIVEDKIKASANNIAIAGTPGIEPPRWVSTNLSFYPNSLLAKLSFITLTGTSASSSYYEDIKQKQRIHESILYLSKDDPGRLSNFLAPPFYDKKSFF